MNPAAKRLLVRLIPDVPVTRTVPLIGRFRFRLRRHRWLLSNRCFDGHARNLAMFRRLVRPGDVVYDVGANIGYYTRYIAAHLSPRRVLAFEPMTENVRLLRDNVRLADAGGLIQVFPVALSDHEGQEALQVDDVMGGTAVLDSIAGGEASHARRRLGLAPRTEPVEVATLDGLLSRSGEPPPDMMKIDTEGAEVTVLRGAAGVLERHSPRLLIATHGPELARQVAQFLAVRGYHCYGYRRGAGGYGPLAGEGSLDLADNNIVASRDEADVRDAPDAPDAATPTP